MELFSSIYLLFFIVLAFLVYWNICKTEHSKNYFLAFFSFSIISYINIYLSIFIVVFTYLLSIFLFYFQKKVIKAKAIIFSTVAITLLIIFFTKYSETLYYNFDHATQDWVIKYLVMPFGISYFILRVIQYVFDCSRNVIKHQSFLKLFLFITFFPTFPAGPIETYQGFHKKRINDFNLELSIYGIKRITLGYFKKFFIVDFIILGSFSEQILLMNSNTSLDSGHPLFPLFFLSIMFIRAYFDLSAYTDIAIGTSALFGFKIQENFDKPFLAKNLSEFWSRWHMSLSSWCRNNVFFPVLGITKLPWLGLYASMLTMGLWHYVNWNWFLWAIYHSTGLLFLFHWEKLKRKNIKLKSFMDLTIMKYLSILITFFYVSLGYSFVSIHEIERAIFIFFSTLKLTFNFLIFFN